MEYNLGKREKEDTKGTHTFSNSTIILSIPCKPCAVLGPVWNTVNKADMVPTTIQPTSHMERQTKNSTFLNAEFDKYY